LSHFFEPQQEPSVADAKNASGSLLLRVVADVADESRGKRNKGIEVDLRAAKTRIVEFGRYAEQNRQNRGDGKPES